MDAAREYWNAHHRLPGRENVWLGIICCRDFTFDADDRKYRPKRALGYEIVEEVDTKYGMATFEGALGYTLLTEMERFQNAGK